MKHFKIVCQFVCYEEAESKEAAIDKVEEYSFLEWNDDEPLDFDIVSIEDVPQ
jgi:hypothetical protein